MKLPNVFLVGAQKAGTTSVYDWLIQHPNIDGKVHMKDYPFFSEDHLYEKGLDYFSNFFNSCNSNVIVAGSVHIMFYKIALERISFNIPNAKLILVLRNPIARAFSSYRYAKERGLENRNFMSCINDELNKKVDLYKTSLDKNQKFYLRRGLYVDQIQNIYSMFDKDNVFIGLYDDIIKDKDSFIRSLFSFLNVESNFTCDFVSSNVTKGKARFKILNKLIYNQKLRNNLISNKLKFIFPQKYKFLIRRALKEFNRVQDLEEININNEEKMLLKKYYIKDIDRLEILINRDLTNWKV